MTKYRIASNEGPTPYHQPRMYLCDGNRVMAQNLSPADAMRIVTCLNACEGADSDALYAGGRSASVAPALLAALENVLCAAVGSYVSDHPAAVDARRVIAAARGGQS